MEEKKHLQQAEWKIEYPICAINIFLVLLCKFIYLPFVPAKNIQHENRSLSIEDTDSSTSTSYFNRALFIPYKKQLHFAKDNYFHAVAFLWG